MLELRKFFEHFVNECNHTKDMIELYKVFELYSINLTEKFDDIEGLHISIEKWFDKVCDKVELIRGYGDKVTMEDIERVHIW